ncbi:MAG: rRNA maturation RNase YbeY [Bacteroidales bacterium]
MKTRIFYYEVKYRLRNSKKILKVIEKVIREYRKPGGSLSFILMNDKEIIKINREFLKHDYNTDVIAFDYGNSFLMEGEVYMSLETIKVNAINYKVSFRKELLRVMIHGTLHLCGFNDSTENERRTMKKKEDEWLLKMVRI